MAMGGGPPLHRRPRGAGAAETTSWAVGGAPHMSPTPIWLVGIVAGGHRGDGGDRGGAQQPFLSMRVQPPPGTGPSHFRRVLAASIEARVARASEA